MMPIDASSAGIVWQTADMLTHNLRWRYTGKNREKNVLKICVFLQNSEIFSQNEQFFSQIVWLSESEFWRKTQILRTFFSRFFPV
jgi:hypothetical protein